MYKEITKIIFKMKSSTSPCPFDQISIVVLIKCSYRRIYLWRIISASWTRGGFPTVWKPRTTVLVYKKNSNEDLSNFIPITLQPVLSKYFASILCSRIYDFGSCAIILVHDAIVPKWNSLVKNRAKEQTAKQNTNWKVKIHVGTIVSV